VLPSQSPTRAQEKAIELRELGLEFYGQGNFKNRRDAEYFAAQVLSRQEAKRRLASENSTPLGGFATLKPNED